MTPSSVATVEKEPTKRPKKLKVEADYYSRGLRVAQDFDWTGDLQSVHPSVLYLWLDEFLESDMDDEISFGAYFGKCVDEPIPGLSLGSVPNHLGEERHTCVVYSITTEEGVRKGSLCWDGYIKYEHAQDVRAVFGSIVEDHTVKYLDGYFVININNDHTF